MDFEIISKVKNLKGKRVLVRVDWNVPMKNGEVVDDFRIKKSLPTLEYLAKAKAKVIIATHLEPVGTSLEPLRKYVPEGMELLENLRDNPGEKSNSLEFAQELASRADIYVNEAFSVSHREHASIVLVPKLLPSYAGLQFAEEVKQLAKVFYPPKPFLFVLGGAKFDTKLPILKKFLPIADSIFVGGALAHNFFKEQGKEIGNSLVSENNFNLLEVLATGKIVLPEDMLVLREGKLHIDTIGHIKEDDNIVDAGTNTLLDLKERIKRSSCVLWNGPLGNYELGYKASTLELARALAQSGKQTIVGGEDTMAAIKELNLFDKFTFVSTGGGAMLDFLATGTLPGIKALKG